MGVRLRRSAASRPDVDTLTPMKPQTLQAVRILGLPFLSVLSECSVAVTALRLTDNTT